MLRVKPGWIVLLLMALGMVGLLVWFLGSRRIFEPALQVGCTGSPTPAFTNPRVVPTSLVGARIMLNPGHGITLTDKNTWGFQRPKANGFSVFVLEDDSNIRIARAVKKVLEAAGAVVLSTRELERSTVGSSGEAVWREASKHHLSRIGVNKGIWNSRGFSLRSDCRLAQDIRARPLYANFEKADLMLSFHSNAGNFLARGTQVFYAERSFLRAAPKDLGLKNACFAKLLAISVPKQIRLDGRPNWKNGSTTASNQYGENGFALMPSAILEVAFHTNRADGAALMQESFRVAVATGIRDALNSFFKNPKC